MKTLSERPEDYCFIDFETRTDPDAFDSDGDLRKAGTYRYAKHSFPTVLTYAIGNDPVKIVALDQGFSEPLKLPDELNAFWARARDRKAWFVAWNMGFDRAVWNNWMPGRPMAPEMALDAMAQGLAQNIPPDLERASTTLGGAGKQKDGKKLIGIFAPTDGGTPQSHPNEWKLFKAYAMQDIDALRYVWGKTRPLPPAEWVEYWASERINERGVMIDTDFCRKAYAMSVDSTSWLNKRLEELTDGEVPRVTLVKRIARWVFDNLNYPEARSLMIVEDDDGDEADFGLDDEEGGEHAMGVDQDKPVPPIEPEYALVLDRPIVQRILAYMNARDDLNDHDRKVIEVLEIREFGGSSSPVKFRKMADQCVNDRLQGQYVFNGAGQTGRFSSKGAQLQNAPRESMGDLEAAAMEDIGLPVPAYVEKYGSIGRVLPRLIRPCIIAPEGKVLVWADLSNIEARVNPWLADSQAGRNKLAIFRASDAHPDHPDVYMNTAAALIGCAPSAVTKKQRQSHGKVPELSLGFGGAKGALLNMATMYGEYVSDEQADDMVEKWRAANPWARKFWNQIWLAIENAMDTHGVVFRAGRVAYQFVPGLLGGSLLCMIPGGRVLTYPHCKWEKVVEDDTLPKEEQTTRLTLMYGKGKDRAGLWYGKACENVVQGTAGSLLRNALVTLREHETWMPVVLHTHDDICVEVDEEFADKAAAILLDAMTVGPDWAEGLPLAAEATTGWYWSKAAGREIGLSKAA